MHECRKQSKSFSPAINHIPKRETTLEPSNHIRPSSTVGFLVSRTRTWAAELLWFASPVVGDEECAVVLDKGLLQLVLGVLIDVFLVVCDLRLFLH
jgi:hypothetical protein